MHHDNRGQGARRRLHWPEQITDQHGAAVGARERHALRPRMREGCGDAGEQARGERKRAGDSQGNIHEAHRGFLGETYIARPSK